MDEQKYFTKGSKLEDETILIHKIIHSLNTIRNKGLIIKLDMKNSFARVNWYFLLCMIENNRFVEGWIGWILVLIGNP